MNLEYLYLSLAEQMRLSLVLTFYNAHKYSVNAVTDAALVFADVEILQRESVIKLCLNRKTACFYTQNEHN